jgi:hypothetical protein
MTKNNFFSRSIQQLVFVALLFVTSFSSAQTKWADWTFTSPSYNIINSSWDPAFYSPGTLQNGISSMSSSFNNGITSQNSPGGGLVIPTCGATVNIASTPYVQFSFNHSATSIDFDRFVLGGMYSGATGYGFDVELRWSVDNYATSLGSKSFPGVVNDYKLVSFDLLSQANVITGTAVVFRLYFKNVTTNLPIYISNTYNTNYDSTPATYTSANKAISVWYNAVTIPVPVPSITSFTPLVEQLVVQLQ